MLLFLRLILYSRLLINHIRDSNLVIYHISTAKDSDGLNIVWLISLARYLPCVLLLLQLFHSPKNLSHAVFMHLIVTSWASLDFLLSCMKAAKLSSIWDFWGVVGWRGNYCWGDWNWFCCWQIEVLLRWIELLLMLLELHLLQIKLLLLRMTTWKIPPWALSLILVPSSRIKLIPPPKILLLLILILVKSLSLLKLLTWWKPLSSIYICLSFISVFSHSVTFIYSMVELSTYATWFWWRFLPHSWCGLAHFELLKFSYHMSYLLL